MGFNIDQFPGGFTYAKLSALLADGGYTLLSSEQNMGTPFTGTS